MFPHHSLVALWFVSSAGAVFHGRGSGNFTASYSNVTLITVSSVPVATESTETDSAVSSQALQPLHSIHGSGIGLSSGHGYPHPTDAGSSGSPASPSFTNISLSVVEVHLNTTSFASGVLSIATSVATPTYYNATSIPSRRVSNATCTVNIPSASVDWWYPPTYSHVLGTMTTAAPNFTNVDSYTLIPQITTFDAASALESNFACTSSESYVSEWDWTMTLCVDYTEKPTAAATSIAYRTAAAPFPSGGLIPVTDAWLYDLYTDGRPSATATISMAPNVTRTETSATPFVYFTAYEVESGNKTETVQLRSVNVYPYWLKGVEQETTATGALPEGFLEQIPQSACDAGQLQATVTVLIVVDLYYQNWPNLSPFIIHFESTALGFDDPPVTINGHDPSKPPPLTMSDWDLPDVPNKPTSVSMKPQVRPDSVPTTEAGNNNNNNNDNSNNNNNIFNTGGPEPQVPSSPQPTRITVGTVGTNLVIIGLSSEVIVGSQTLRPGGPPITLGAGTPVSLAPSATALVVGGTTTKLPQIFGPPAELPARSPPVLTIGSSTLTPNAATQFFVAPGQTLTPGGIATVDGTVVSLAPSASFVVIGGSTQVLPTAGLGSGPAATSPPKIVVGGSTITAQPNVGGSENPSNQNNPEPRPTFVISDQTLAPGGHAITVSGTTLSLAPSGSFVVVNGVTSTIAFPTAPANPPPTLTVGNKVFSPLTESGNTFVIAGQTLAPGGSAITVLGTTVSLAPSASFVVINGVTSTIANSASPAVTLPTLNIGNGVFSPLPGSGTTFVISDQTLSPGGSAITVLGATISLAQSASFVVINGVTSTLAHPAAAQITPLPLTIGNGVFKPLPGTETAYVIGSTLLTPGGSIVVAGTTISLAPGATALIINGQTSLITNQAHPVITDLPLLTIGSQTFTAVPRTGVTFLVGGQTLTPGGMITVDGTTISLAPEATALIMNGQTSLIANQAQPMITNPPLLTIGSKTYTAVSGTGTTFLIGGQTLTPGGTITVDGTTISLASGATELIYGSSGRSTTTALFPATTTRSQKVTSTSNPSAAATRSDGQAAATSEGQAAAFKAGVHGSIISAVVAILGLLFA